MSAFDHTYIDWPDQKIEDLVNECMRDMDADTVPSVIGSSIIGTYLRFVSSQSANVNHARGEDGEKAIALSSEACGAIGVECSNTISKAIWMYMSRLPNGQQNVDACVIAFMGRGACNVQDIINQYSQRN